MKRIYSTLRPPVDQKSYADWIKKCNQKLSVSSKGLLAFTSSFCLSQTRPSSSSYHVYIADINTPYQPYLLVDSEYEFTIVEWDPSGTKLLVCDVRGCATIYTSKEFLISDWKPYFKQNFAAETFISATWYHPGIVSAINVANQNLKNPSNHLEYTDKIQQNKYGASLRLFGGKSTEGCLLVSRTGLVCCLTLIADGSVDVISESLGPLRHKIEVADICHHEDGSFVVATSTGPINSTIFFYQLRLSTKNLTVEELDMSANFENKRVYLSCKQFYSFHPNIMAQILEERENSLNFERVSHIKFFTKDSPDVVLVEISGQNISLLELWELETKRESPIHNGVLESNKSATDSKPNMNAMEENGSTTTAAAIAPEETFRDWSFKGNYIIEKELVKIQTPKFKIFGADNQLNLILLAYKDASICCMRKDDLQLIHENHDLLNLVSSCRNTNGRMDIDNPPYKVYSNRSNNISSIGSKVNLGDKKQRAVHITDIQFSINQTTFIAIDSMSQIHAFSLPPLIECEDSKDSKDLENYLQYILEYCLITGNDWWDVMVCAKHGSIESICDKFHDAFERQPKYMKRKYFNRQLMIRASLYRILNTTPSLCKSSDCHAMIMLNSIASTLKSMLASEDKTNPSEFLTIFFKTSQGTQPNSMNCNNVISNLKEDEKVIDPALIQCLQPLSQWVTDLAIFLIVSIPQKIKLRTVYPGDGLAKDKEALELIRELLVIIKIWGSQNEASLPTVQKLNDEIDVIDTLYRLVSILYTTLGKEPEESFVEECVRLSNSISIPQFVFSLAPVGVASPLLHQKRNESHLTLEFFKEPTMNELATFPKIDGAINMNGKRKMDIVRNISLGVNPVTNLRHCTRCKSVSLIKPSFNSTRIWEQRWIASCVCGGSWAQLDCDFISKVGYVTRYHQSTILTSLSHGQQLAR